MPRGLVLRGSAWVETEVTREMLTCPDGTPWSCTSTGHHGDHYASRHVIMHPIGHAVVNMLLSFIHVCKGINIIRPQGTLVYATDANGQLTDYNPLNLIIPCMIPQIVQSHSLVMSGGGSTGLHLRSIEVCREMCKRSLVYRSISQLVIALTQDGANCGEMWFVILGNESTNRHNNLAVDIVNERDICNLVRVTLPVWGFGAEERLAGTYIYIIYTVGMCIMDITHAPMAATMLSRILSDEDAMIFASQH